MGSFFAPLTCPNSTVLSNTPDDVKSAAVAPTKQPTG